MERTTFNYNITTTLNGSYRQMNSAYSACRERHAAHVNDDLYHTTRTFPEGLLVEAGYIKMPPYLSVRCISATIDPT